MTSDRAERLLRVINSHWIVYVMPVLFSALLLGFGTSLLLAAAYAAAENHWLWPWSFLGGSVLVLLSMHVFFFFAMGEYLTKILITTRRLIEFDDVLIVREDMREFTFEKMKSVEARKHGILQYALNYGSLLFESGGKGIVHYVPHPNTAARDIVQAMGMV